MPKHILVIRLSAMGDVAMTVPILKAFSLQYPAVKITIVSRLNYKPFFDQIENLNFFAVDLKNRHKGFLGLLRLFFDLKSLKITNVADLHNVLRSKIIRNLFLLIGKKTAATNKGRKEKKYLTRLENKEIYPLKTMFERHIETFKKQGFTISLKPNNILNKKKLSQKIITITQPKTTKWLGIAPFAQHEGKVYPQYLMQKIIDELAKTNVNIFLFGGGKQEIEKLNQLKNNHQNIIVLAGKLNINEELEVISNLDVMLSMDSGNAHLAAMFGVKTITIWGATHPFAGFAPFNQPNDLCIVANREKYPFLPTSVYGNKKVKGYENIMETILPKTVIDKVLSEM